MSPILQALNPWYDSYEVKPLSMIVTNPVARCDARVAGEAAGLASPPLRPAAEPIHSSDERTDEAKAREASIMEWEAVSAVHEPHTERQAGMESERSSLSEWPAGTMTSPSAGCEPAGRLSHAEMLDEIETLLRSYCDEPAFNSPAVVMPLRAPRYRGDITDISLIDADPPPIFLRRRSA